jgi:hypothetical protein
MLSGVCASLDAVVQCVPLAYVHQDNSSASVLRHLRDACRICWNRAKNVQEGQVYDKCALQPTSVRDSMARPGTGNKPHDRELHRRDGLVSSC